MEQQRKQVLQQEQQEELEDVQHGPFPVEQLQVNHLITFSQFDGFFSSFLGFLLIHQDIVETEDPFSIPWFLKLWFELEKLFSSLSLMALGDRISVSLIRIDKMGFFLLIFSLPLLYYDFEEKGSFKFFILA